METLADAAGVSDTSAERDVHGDGEALGKVLWEGDAVGDTVALLLLVTDGDRDELRESLGEPVADASLLADLLRDEDPEREPTLADGETLATAQDVAVRDAAVEADGDGELDAHIEAKIDAEESGDAETQSDDAPLKLGCDDAEGEPLTPADALYAAERESDTEGEELSLASDDALAEDDRDVDTEPTGERDALRDAAAEGLTDSHDEAEGDSDAERHCETVTERQRDSVQQDVMVAGRADTLLEPSAL